MPYFKKSEEVELYYETHGNGPRKVLLIMGLMVDCHAYILQVQYLMKHSDIELCIFDNRGAGLSSCPTGRYTTSLMAEDALDLVNYLKWDKIHLCGISMGGMISQELSLMLGPDRIESLTLLCTHAGGMKSMVPIYGLKYFLKGLSIDSSDIDLIVDNLMNLLYGSNVKTNKALEDKIREFHSKRAKRGMRPQPNGIKGQLGAVLTHYVSASRLAQIRDAPYPKIVATGDEDLLVSPRNSYHIAELIGSKLIVFPGAGHGLLAGNEDEVNAILEEQIYGLTASETSLLELSAMEEEPLQKIDSILKTEISSSS